MDNSPVHQVLQAISRESLPGPEEIKSFIDKEARQYDEGTQLTLKLSNLPNFSTVSSVDVLLKQVAKLTRSVYYIEPILGENGDFLIRFLQPLDARNVCDKLDNLTLYGRLINIQVETKNHPDTTITTDFERRFQQYFNSKRTKIIQKLELVQKKRQQLQETQSSETYDPKIEEELEAQLEAIDKSLILSRPISMVENNKPYIETTRGDDKIETLVAEDDGDDDQLEIIEDEPVECASVIGGSVDCEENEQNIADSEDVTPEGYQRHTVENYKVLQFEKTNTQPNLIVANVANDCLINSEDHITMDQTQQYFDDDPFNIEEPDNVSDIQDKNDDSTNKNIEISETEIGKEQQNEISQDHQEIRNNLNKTEICLSTNKEDITINESDKNTITNKIFHGESTDVTQAMPSKINETVTPNSSQNVRVPVAVKRKLDSDIDAGKGTASKTSKSQDKTCNLLKANMKVPFPYHKRVLKDYGLNPNFLDYLGLKLPLSNRIIVEGLHESVNEAKLKEVFSMAGEIREIVFNNKNLAEIEYDHQLEAVQAISMFGNHKLYDKMMRISMAYTQRFLPPGLSTIGKGFGPNGIPLKRVGTVIEQRELKEILFEMGRAKKRMIKNSSLPFHHYYRKRIAIQSNSVDEEQAESTSIFTLPVPGTGELNEMPPLKTPDSTLRELNGILKERGLIPGNVECKTVKDVLRVLNTEISVTNQSRSPIEIEMSNTINRPPGAGSNASNTPNTSNLRRMQQSQQHNFDQQMPQNMMFHQNNPQARRMAIRPNIMRNQPLIARNRRLMNIWPRSVPPHIRHLQFHQNIRPNRPWYHPTF